MRKLFFLPSLKTEFVRYVAASGLAFVADFATLSILVSGLEMHYLAATILGFIVGVTVNYQLSILWVFSYRALRQPKLEFILFLATGLVTLGLAIVLMLLLVGGLGLHYLLAKCITTGVTLIVNFTLRRFLLFTRHTPRIQKLHPVSGKERS